MIKAYDKPVPELDGLTAQFYAFCQQQDLHFQRCSNCQCFRHVPREVCADCNSFDWEWVRASGRGRVYTWTVVERALHPAFIADTPLAPVVVEMEEGVRLLATMLDCPAAELAIDMPVTIAYEAVTNEITLPRFRRS